jgi:hypothetical protein
VSDAETVALISTAGLVLVALIGIWAEQIRTRRRAGAAAEHAETAAHETRPNHGSSMRDVVDRIERRQINMDERLLGLEKSHQSDRAALDEHLTAAAERDRLIGLMQVQVGLRQPPEPPQT